MKERRVIEDRRNKEPKEGLPYYYRRYKSDRRKNNISPEWSNVENISCDTTSQVSSVKSTHLPNN
jgi:hypothetical protein